MNMRNVIVVLALAAILCTQVAQCTPVKAQEADNGLECTVCEWVLGEVDKYISNNSTEAEITQIVEGICNIVPKSLQPTCQTFIAQYGPEIINLLVQKADPDTICTQIGLCTSEDQEITVSDDSNGLECTICDWVLGEIENYVASNSTEQEIIQIVDGICNIVPKSLRAVCTTFIEQYGPEVIQLLVQKESPDAICKQIGLCTSSDDETEAASADNGLECTICDWVLGEVEKYVSSNSTEQEIIQIVDGICNIVPKSLQSICTTFIGQYGPEIINLLVQKESPDAICQQLGLCSSSEEDEVVAANADNGLECTVCEWVLGEVEKYISSNTTEGEIIQIVDNVCNLFHGSLNAMCKTFIGQYGPEIINLLVQRESPDTICTQIGLCTSSKTAVVEQKVESGLECTACEWVMGEIEKYISSNSTEAEIIAVVSQVCNILPKSVRGMCDAFVSEYGEEVLQLLIQRESPDTICAQIGLCSSATQQIVYTIPAVEEKSVTGLECTICDWVIGEVEKYVSSNSTEEEVVQIVENICNVIPKSLASICDAYIEAYAPELIQLLLQKESPQAICGQLHVCQSAQETVVIAPVEVKLGGLECTICDWVIGEVEKYVSSNSTEEEIINVIESICKVVPKALSGVCDAYIETYGPMVIQLLLQKESPSTVCGQIHVCKSEEAVAAPVVLQGAECTLCTYVATYLEKALSAAPTQAEIVTLLEDVCGALPGALQSPCDTFVSTYASYFIDMLLRAESPSAICGAIGVCPKEQAVEPIVEETQEDGENGLECAICQWVMAEVEKLINANSTQSDIIQALEKVCTILPKSVEGVCNDFVMEYYPEIVQLLLAKENPDTICNQIKLCTGAQTEEEVIPAVELTPAVVNKVEGMECAACEWVMSTVENYISENTTETEIITLLSNVCNLVPGALKQECSDLLENYGPELIQLLVQREPADTICKQIGMCTSARKEQKAVVALPEVCPLCEWLFTKVDAFLEEPTEEEAIVKALEKVCSLLPAGEMQQLCDSILDAAGPDVVDMIIRKETPDVICSQLRLCRQA